MSALTTLTRMWLCRSLRPFTFQKEYDQTLPYEDSEIWGFTSTSPSAGRFAAFVPTAKRSTARKPATVILIRS